MRSPTPCIPVLLLLLAAPGCVAPAGILEGDPTPRPWEPPAEVPDDDDSAPAPVEGPCAARLQCDDPLVYNVKQLCDLEIARADGSVDYAGPVTAWGRGRSSSRVPKTQYGLELQDGAGDEAAANLLGMGRESDWVLNGNHYDRSLVRNKTGYDLFQAMGGPERYAPESAFCELELNGEYRGVYSLVERIKRDDDRVQIADVDDGSAFVVKKLDHECFYPLTTAIHCWKLVSPNDAALLPGAADTLTAWFTEWEAAVRQGATTGDDGVFAYVDLDSAVDIVLLEEFMKNEDAWTHSVHAWKDPGGTMHFAPWDLDMTWGNLWYHGTYGSPETWVVYRPEMVTGMSDTQPFRDRLVTRWAELRAGPFATEAVLERVSANQALLGEAIERNFDRWDIRDVNYAGYFYDVADYGEEDAWVRAWIRTRLEWMDANVADYAR